MAHTENGIGSLAYRDILMRPLAVTGLWAPDSPGPAQLDQGLRGTASGADLT